MNRAQVGAVQQAGKIRLGRLLQREHGLSLEAQVRHAVLRDLAHQALELQLVDEELGRLLDFSNITERDGTRFPSCCPLHTGARGRPGRHGDLLLSRRLASSGLTGQQPGNYVVRAMVLILFAVRFSEEAGAPEMGRASNLPRDSVITALRNTLAFVVIEFGAIRIGPGWLGLCEKLILRPCASRELHLHWLPTKSTAYSWTSSPPIRRQSVRTSNLEGCG